MNPRTRRLRKLRRAAWIFGAHRWRAPERPRVLTLWRYLGQAFPLALVRLHRRAVVTDAGLFASIRGRAGTIVVPPGVSIEWLVPRGARTCSR